MHLARLYIRGFRSIEELDLQFQPGLNIIVGRNNAGKSNIVRAIDLVLGENSPTYAKSENVSEKDFRSVRSFAEDGTSIDEPGTEFFIWCELHRGTGEILNFDELYKCIGFYISARATDWWRPSGKVKSREPKRVAKEALPRNYPEVFDVTEDEAEEKEYINPKLRNQQTYEKCLGDKYRFAYGFRAVRDGDFITRELRFFFRETDNDDWVMAFRASIRNELLQSAIIPSFRDPQTQLRPTHWSWFGKLMRHLTAASAKSTELQEAFATVRNLADGFFSQARDALMESSLKVAFPDTQLHFQFSADSRTELYKSCALYVDDGLRSPLADKGSGIQSAVVIGLFSYYTQHVNTVTSALLCIEEPEIYLHPHAQRVISARLNDFLAAGRNQVILTTHSPEFISARTGAETLTLVRRHEGATCATVVQLRDYRELVLDLDQGELFFADKVIVCEGLDAYVLRAVCREAFPEQLDAQNVSIVCAFGKDKLDRLVSLARRLGFPVYLVADFDYLLRDGNHLEAKAHGGKSHKNIFALTESFFTQPTVLGDEGEALFRKLQATISHLKEADPAAFYTAKRLSEIPDPYQKQLRDDLLPQLRRAGVCVLDGEVEDAVIDNAILHEGKFNMESVFRLHETIASGAEVTTLVDSAQFTEFLAHVLGHHEAEPVGTAEESPEDLDWLSDEVPF